MRNPVKELIKNFNDVTIEKNPNSISDVDLLFDIWYKEKSGSFHIIIDKETQEPTQATLALFGERIQTLNTNTNMAKLAKMVIATFGK